MTRRAVQVEQLLSTLQEREAELEELEAHGVPAEGTPLDDTAQAPAPTAKADRTKCASSQ